MHHWGSLLIRNLPPYNVCGKSKLDVHILDNSYLMKNTFERFGTFSRKPWSVLNNNSKLEYFISKTHHQPSKERLWIRPHFLVNSGAHAIFIHRHAPAPKSWLQVTENLSPPTKLRPKHSWIKIKAKSKVWNQEIISIHTREERELKKLWWIFRKSVWKSFFTLETEQSTDPCGWCGW